jgi:acyl-coenzyme A thioesterase 13
VNSHKADVSDLKVEEWLGGRILFSREDSLEMEFVTNEEMLNPFGTLHGGVIAAMMMEAIAEASRIVNGDALTKYAVVDFRADFLARVRAGTVLRAKVTVVRSGSTVITNCCSLLTVEGDLVANGIATSVRL